MEHIFEIELDSGAKYKARGEDSLTLKEGDWCVVRKDFYLDFGKVAKVFEEPPKDDEKGDMPKVQRKATVVDQGKAHENQVRGKSALRTAGLFIERLNLPMKLINAHYSFDGKLITIQFSAEGRVDFRELVKQLSHTMNTRIELRQIGVRDETAIMGGIAVCGRPLCCAAFLKEFSSINVRMAKEQDLSLTPSTISGLCGRLKCCLKYEHAGYLEMDKSMPRRGDCCECKDGRGRVIDRNLLSQKVVVQLEETNRCVTCVKDEISVVYPEKYRVKSDGRREPTATDTIDRLPSEIRKLED